MEYKLPNYDIFTEWTDAQHFQRIDKYTNYLWDEGRLETWAEVVGRTVDTLRYLSNNYYADSDYQRMFELIYTLDVMPSMRLLSMPLEAIKRCNSVLYNCSFGLCDNLKIFSEAMYLSMSGVGVSWSVENKNISKLPSVVRQNGSVDNLIVEDTQEGWAKSISQLTNALFAGSDIVFDYSKLRPSGSPLKTKGGFASGPDPLIRIHAQMRRIIKNAQGRQLKSIEVHDIMCWMLEAGISGATRRSAGLVLFDKEDQDLLSCKYSGFWNNEYDKVRANANNSLVWTGQVTKQDVDDLTYPWFHGTGEPGLFTRNNSINTSPKHREFKHPEYVGINPCGEIILAPAPVDSDIYPGGGWQFCNLSSINAWPTDSINDLEEKTYYATLIGDIQSLATDFAFIRPATKDICDHDRLLGVNIIGHATTESIRDSQMLTHLRRMVESVDRIFSKTHNVPVSAAATSVKPSGNHMVLCHSTPGMNALHGVRMIRNMTVNRNSTMHNFLEAQGVPRHDYPGRDYASMFSFPISYPDDSISLETTTALEQLKVWELHKIYWCHHNPSCTITYHEHEIDEIKKWLYDNQHLIGGLAFFPHFTSFELAPIVVIDDEKYRDTISNFPKIGWNYYDMYNTGNNERTIVAECSGGRCDI